jgi:small-conductance mechanosensitive channel
MNSDDTLIRLAGSSAPVRLLSRTGEFLVRTWHDSASAARLSDWRAVPAPERVRLTAITAMVMFITHIVLTGFNAPEPIVAARVSWIVILLLLWMVATRSRGVVAAWTEWTARRRARTH